MKTLEIDLKPSDLTDKLTPSQPEPQYQNHVFSVEPSFADLDTTASHNKKFIYGRALMLNLAFVWMGYYWALYNELFYHITEPYGISASDDWIHGSINSIFFFGGIIGSLIIKILPNHGNKIKYFIWLDLAGILCILTAVIPNIWCL